MALLLNNQTILLILLLIICLIVELLFNTTFIIYSIPVIKYLQGLFSNHMMIFKAISSCASPVILYPIMILTFLTHNTNASFKLIKAYYYTKYLGNLLKIVLASPRPFWLSRDIITKCHTGYGNPSGHSFISTSFYLVLSHVLLQAKPHPSYTPSMTIVVILFRKSLPYILYTLISMIMLSRIVLGVHSIDQVILGALLGYLLYKAIIYFDNEAPINLQQECLWFMSLITGAYGIYYTFYRTEGFGLFEEICGRAVQFPCQKAWIALLGVVGVYGGVCGRKAVDSWRVDEIAVKDGDWKRMGVGGLYYVCYAICGLGVRRILGKKVEVPVMAFVFALGLYGGLGKLSIMMNNDTNEDTTLKQGNTTNNTNINDNNNTDNDDEESCLIKS